MIVRRQWIPSTSALLAFESAARHCNFSRAAEELNTSQSAISRHVAGLEARLKTRLFDRHKKRLRLTDEGERFFRAVVSGLENIQVAAMAVANSSEGDQVTIACTHEVSHLFIMPRFEALQRELGDAASIRVMTFDYDTIDMMLEPQIDLLFGYQAAGTEPEDRVIALRETVVPVCSPAFAAEHGAALMQNAARWGELPFLELTKQNRGWATWDDWFAHAGAPAATPRFTGFENYVYLLEAAAAGRGLALGWLGMIGRYLDAGTLIMAADEPATFDRPFYALLTRRGRERPAARRCLAFFRET